MIKNIVAPLFLIFMSLLTAGCATTQYRQQPPAQNKNISWEGRAQKLSMVKTWNLNALIAIRHKQDAWSATLNWQQQNQSYHIVLFGPLGSHSYDLMGQPGSVKLTAANGKSVTASNPESLLLKQTGAEIPVSNLLYWIRGLPVPSCPVQKKFDAYNHLIVLEQQGWTIQYLRFVSVNNIDMPSKIFLVNPHLNVKILINHWEF